MRQPAGDSPRNTALMQLIETVTSSQFGCVDPLSARCADLARVEPAIDSPGGVRRYVVKIASPVEDGGQRQHGHEDDADHVQPAMPTIAPPVPKAHGRSHEKRNRSGRGPEQCHQRAKTHRRASERQRECCQRRVSARDGKDRALDDPKRADRRGGFIHRGVLLTRVQVERDVEAVCPRLQDVARRLSVKTLNGESSQQLATSGLGHAGWGGGALQLRRDSEFHSDGEKPGAGLVAGCEVGEQVTTAGRIAGHIGRDRDRPSKYVTGRPSGSRRVGPNQQSLAGGNGSVSPVVMG